MSMPPRKPTAPRTDWLSRALSRAGVMPAAEAEAAILGGRVTLNGRKVSAPLTLLRPGDVVRLDGSRLELEAPPVQVLAFHKPKGAITATTDKEGNATVFQLLQDALPPELRRVGWHAVGRLDRDTTGLLLFTNDEQLLAHVTSPKTKLPKHYLATLAADATDAQLAPLRKGMTLDDGLARPARVRLLGPRELELTLTEGRNHQAKRMLGAVGLPVLKLHRAAIGSVTLDVPEGAYRALTGREIREGLGYKVPGSSP